MNLYSTRLGLKEGVKGILVEAALPNS